MAPFEGDQKISKGLRQLCANGHCQECQIIIELAGSEAGEVDLIVHRCHGEILRRITLFPCIVAKAPLAMITELAKCSQVKKIWADSAIKTTNPSGNE